MFTQAALCYNDYRCNYQFRMSPLLLCLLTNVHYDIVIVGKEVVPISVIFQNTADKSPRRHEPGAS